MFFTNEEGSRFPHYDGLLGLPGTLPLDARCEMQRAFLLARNSSVRTCGGCPHSRPGALRFVELHIEQGLLLDAHDPSVGGGRSGFPGRGCGSPVSPPMQARLDRHEKRRRTCRLPNPLALHDIVTSFGGDMVGTVGRQSWHPNLVNVVPSRVEMTIDLRPLLRSN